MAIRVIREIGDDILEKQCKAVPKMTLRTKILIGDMLETMYESNGVGLAAPQVGVLKWKAKACLQGRFAMNLIIWTENCMLNWQKTDFMKCLMMKKIKTMRKEGKNENHIYGNTRFFGRNTGSACGSGA